MVVKRSSRLGIAFAILVLLVLALSGAHAGVTKNVILMIGDGMGFGHVNAGSYYLHGAAGTLCFEPYYKCSVTTSCLDSIAHPITDSAAAASALATGHKVNYTAISQSPAGVPYTTILEHAKTLGKRTGFVGTDPISRATPGAFGCHDPSRYNYLAMTDDLLNSSRPDVMMGGGATPTAGSEYVSVAQVNTAISLGYQVAYTKAAMDAISNSASRVLGLFATLDLTYEHDRLPGNTEPHLSEQTAKALALLDTDPDGFFLMVEGAKIDYGAHANDIALTTGEVVEFNNSVQVVLDWMEGRTDTLLIVTADHETGGLTATNNGQGNYAGASWSSAAKDHTAANVPLYALGSNAGLFGDYISGEVMDNTDVFTAMQRAFTAAPYAAAPYKIYDQFGYGTGGDGSVYYGGGVFDGTFYTGQITAQAQQWRDEQIGGTALMNATPFLKVQNPAAPAPNNFAKASLPLGGYIYGACGGDYIYRTATWDCTGGLNLVTGCPTTVEGICTDGTYIYMTSGTSANYNKIYKLAVAYTGGTYGGGSVSVVSGWPVAIGTGGTSGNTRFRGISYYNGRIYAINNKGTYGQIYEIDASTRAATNLATVTGPTDSLYQAVRYGNEIFIVGLDDNLHTYQLSGITWTHNSSVDLGLTDLYGIAVKGDGTTAEYAWVTHKSSKVSFYALAPWMATPANLSAPRKEGYPVCTEAVVTAQAPGCFWVENQERTMGAQVAWTGTMPAVGKLVTIQAPPFSKTASGEKLLTASAVTEGATASPAVEPLLVTNKSMGLATGGSGLANDGLLVTVCGKVTYFDPQGGTYAFYIDDGSGVPSDVTGVKGVKVLKADGSMPYVATFDLVMNGSPCYAVITGIVRLELVDGKITRWIQPRSDDDIVITALSVD